MARYRYKDTVQVCRKDSRITRLQYQKRQKSPVEGYYVIVNAGLVTKFDAYDGIGDL